MKFTFSKSQVALATIAALGAMAVVTAPAPAKAAKTAGTYVTGDFHNHTTCSDGSISLQKLVDKSTVTWGLDWFVQAGHGGSYNRNCTLVEDEVLATPAYPYNAAQGPTTTWVSSIGQAAIKGNNGYGAASPNGYMWRWQSIQEFQYPLLEYLSAYKNVPLFMGLESNAPGHEHVSMSVITGQMPAALDTAALPVTAPYAALGNANALAQFEYCFDRSDSDTSRGNFYGTATGNNWNCSVTGSANSASPIWSVTGMKLIQASSSNALGGVGDQGHYKAVESLKWMVENHPNGSYYVPAHLERPGPFNSLGNNGFNIENLRNFNNAAPNIAFGFESQPGHGAADNRGEYQVLRNSYTGSSTKVDSVGGTTYGGTGVYAGQIGGVWDALLGEGRNWWFFASSDWHNRGSFGADDRRSTQDFQPGEYQRDYVMVRKGSDKIRPQTVVDGLRSGNSFVASGQLIDRLAFVACSSYSGVAARTNASVEALAVAAATNNTDIDKAGCATMGEKLAVRPGADIVVSIVVRDPEGANNSPYTFFNPSLHQIGVEQPLNQPVLDHIDVIGGKVTGYKTVGASDYSGAWPRNTDWLKADGSTADLSVVPAGAKNTSAAILKTFGSSGWTAFTSPVDGTKFLKMTFRIPAVSASQYVRLRGTNLPPSTPYETDANGNPLPDVFTNAADATMLRIPCTVSHSTSNQFDGCPDHLATAASGNNKVGLAITNPIVGQKAVSYDVAAWSDLWFYSNPIYVQVSGSTVVAGLK
ncbi:hypothetical protein [Aquabacterium sp.]|uniref:hypothetical protein n=1 Tax=Aquabacterium sp. TaxID=1872578 RepID=UPI0035B4DB62